MPVGSEERRAILVGLTKIAAVDKVPVFSKFEINLTTRDVEKMFLKHYPMARKGSLQFDRKVKGRLGSPFFGITMDNDDPSAEDYNKVLTGAVVMAMDPSPTTARLYAFVNVDG
jgi:hypothetical protein